MIKTLVCLCLFISTQVFAAPYLGAVSSATAGAGRASVEALDSPFLNPATLPYVRGYHFNSSFSASNSVNSTQESNMAVTITDNMKDTILPTSLGYIQTGLVRPDQSKVNSKDFRLAFGQRVLPKLSVGLSGHYKNDKTEFDSYGQTNLTLATALSLSDNLSLGLVYEDFLPPPSVVPEDFKLWTTTGFGLSYNYKRVIRSKLDIVSGQRNTFTRPTISGGVETFMNKWLILRVGAGRNQELKSNILAAGIGFQGPKFGIHYGYQNMKQDENSSRHSVDLAIPIW